MAKTDAAYQGDNSPSQLWELRRELGREISTKRVLYLDLNYWNDLCDVVLGENVSETAITLLNSIRNQVHAGKLVCPLEYTTFSELYKQRLPEKRDVTASLIDELSQGVVLLSPPERVFLEVLRFFQSSAAGPPFPEAPRDEIWTKPAYLLGHGELHIKALDPEVLAELSRLFNRHLWSLGLKDVVSQLGEEQPPAIRAAEIVKKLNEEKFAARKQFTSSKQVYYSEVVGVLDVFSESLSDVQLYLFSRAGGDAEKVTRPQRRDIARKSARLLAAAFRKHDLSAQLPTIHILASLFTHVQWDAGRRYKTNDFDDFHHAAAALAYCDCFATEGPLSKILCDAKIARQYDIAVVSSVDSVIDWLLAPPSQEA